MIMKRKAIIIGEEPQKESKGIEFTHILNTLKGWTTTNDKPSFNRIAKIVYLGKCETDGDMFACYYDVGVIVIYKGNLNDGTY
jgi:hypothetical protein